MRQGGGVISLKKIAVSLVIVLPPVIAYAAFAAVRYVTAREAAYERELERREAEARARGAEQARRAQEIRVERIEAAKKRAAEVKARAYEDYVAAGGDSDSFADFWRIKGTELVMQRMRDRRVARPRQYMDGMGGDTESLKAFTPRLSSKEGS
jgi:hypothetical protein